MTIKNKMCRSPCRALSNAWPIALGKPATIPAKISNEIPLPMPFSVICSPSHIMNTAPVTSVVTATKKKVNPGLYAKPEKLTDIANACTNASATVRSEEHTSELQSRGHLVCRLLLEKKKRKEGESKLRQTKN